MRKMIFALIGLILFCGVASAAVTQVNTSNGAYSIITFTGSGTTTYIPPTGATIAWVVVVGGGGGGGAGCAGGGGAGGYIENTSFPISGAITVVVGGGGAGGTATGAGTNGTATNFSTLSAAGGGGGAAGTTNANGKAGGSGGGGSWSTGVGGLGNIPVLSPVQGYNGGNGIGTPQFYTGGGGGASQKGYNATTASSGNGGNGTATSINGSLYYYGGGGGGGADSHGGYNQQGYGGLGGGGNGGTGEGGAGANGVNNYGGGGGGGSNVNGAGGTGGSGIVILNFTTPADTATFTTNTSSGNYPLTVQFTDTTTQVLPITFYNWSFGDGGQATSQNPLHVYTTPGTYTATLNISFVNWFGTTVYSTNTTTITVNDIAPVANFYGVPAFGSAPLDVSFYDISSGGTATSWQWDWGDSTANGTTQNPTHQYTANGNYTVTMTATNAVGSTTKQRVGYILVGATGGSLSAIFRSNVTTGTYPLCVQFTDLSTGSPDSWLWQFGDSTPNSTDQNPIHTYAAAGSYSVTLTVNNTAATPNTSTETVTNFIVASNPPAPVTPTAQFTGSPTSGSTPMTCTFTDTSTGEARIAWYWDFGDGGTSTLESPVHTYYNVGSYTVKFRATGVDGSSWYNQTDYIVASPPTPSGIPGVNFAANTTYSATSPLVVQFYDQSLGGPTSWLWDFGDGTTSTDQNPVHVYTTGWYDVHLTATNSYGSGTGWQHWFIHVREDFTRVTSSTTITPVSTHAYNVIINSFGGNRTPANESEARINFTQFLFGTTYTYTDIMGNLALVIIFAIPFILMWLMQSDLTIPGIIGIILGGFLFIFLPAEWHMAPVAFIALSIVAIIYGLYMRRE